MWICNIKHLQSGERRRIETHENKYYTFPEDGVQDPDERRIEKWVIKNLD